MRLYYFEGACSLADHIVLEWTGAPYETRRMTRARVKTPEYLAINPLGTVPVLVDEDFTLTENVAILGYVADLHPEANLLGDGTLRARAEVMRWLAFLNSDVHGAFKPLFSPGSYMPDPTAAPQVAETARGRIVEFFAVLERQLEGREFIAGTRSIADPYLFVILRWAVAKQIDMAAFPNLAAFLQRMGDDPAVQVAIAAETGDDN